MPEMAVLWSVVERMGCISDFIPPYPLEGEGSRTPLCMRENPHCRPHGGICCCCCCCSCCCCWPCSFGIRPFSAHTVRPPFGIVAKTRENNRVDQNNVAISGTLAGRFSRVGMRTRDGSRGSGSETPGEGRGRGKRRVTIYNYVKPPNAQRAGGLIFYFAACTPNFGYEKLSTKIKKWFTTVSASVVTGFLLLPHLPLHTPHRVGLCIFFGIFV